MRKLECPRGLHEIESLLGRQTVSGHMSCSLCQRTCYAEPGWFRIEAYDRKADADGRYPWGLVAICPAPDCRDRGRRLVSLVLETMQAAKDILDPSWLEYAGMAIQAPTGKQSKDRPQPPNSCPACRRGTVAHDPQRKLVSPASRPIPMEPDPPTRHQDSRVPRSAGICPGPVTARDTRLVRPR